MKEGILFSSNDKPRAAMIRRIALCTAIVFGFAMPASALGGDGELALIKQPLNTTTISDICDGIYYVTEGKDVSSMRDFRQYFCTGLYSLTLEGKRGQVVTLFGNHDFKKQGGFMVLRKTDDRKVWLSDLALIPEGTWVKRPPTSDSGGVQIFFSPVPNFDQRISSVKWGKWWEGRTPQ